MHDWRLLRGVNPDVEKRRTNLRDPNGNQLMELGLFVRQHAGGIPRSTFLGFYTGNWIAKRSDMPYKGNSRHVMELDEYRIIADKVRGKHYIAAVNEPPPSTTANCAWVAWYDVRDIVSDDPQALRLYRSVATVRSPDCGALELRSPGPASPNSDMIRVPSA